MSRPEKIEFIAMLPANINSAMAVSQTSKEEQGSNYLEAGNFLREFASLQIFKNQ